MLLRVVQRLGWRRWWAVMGRAFVPVDRAIGRLTKGRFVALGIRELPSLLITTTGRRSGEPRTNPLIYAPDGDGFVVIGSNWGLQTHPAWSTNLLTNPQASVTTGGHTIAVRARLAQGDERARLYAMLLRVWPAYVEYERRAGGRELRIFRLERV